MPIGRVLSAAARALRGYGTGRLKSRILEREDQERAELSALRRGTAARAQESSNIAAMRLALDQSQAKRAAGDREAAERYLAQHSPDLAGLGSAGLGEAFQRGRPERQTQVRDATQVRLEKEAQGRARMIALTNKSPSPEGIEAVLAQEFPRLAPGRRSGIAAEAVAWAEAHEDRLGGSGALSEELLLRALGVDSTTRRPR